MWVTGIDENGLGPQLGPLVATAATIEVEHYEAPRWLEVGRAIGIDDSKATTAFGKMALGESLSLAIIEATLGKRAVEVDDVFDFLVPGGLASLKAPCPDVHSAAPCWQAMNPLPVFGGDIERGRAMLGALAEAGVYTRRVRSVVGCAGVLNRSFAEGQSKLAVDLEFFERLITDAREAAPESILAICGMVGGMRKYCAHFRHFGDAATVLAESRPQSEYEIEGVGRVSFEVKADARHLPVAMASMVGKYLRELQMARLNRFYISQDASLPAFSGYHDPVTRRFVEGSEVLRRRLKIADDCFRRRR